MITPNSSTTFLPLQKGMIGGKVFDKSFLEAYVDKSVCDQSINHHHFVAALLCINTLMECFIQL